MDLLSCITKRETDTNMTSWWRGNLPCAYGRASGCENHQRCQKTTYYDENLHPAADGPSPQHPSPSNIEATDPKGCFEIHSCLQVEPATGGFLPQVHASVVYTLAFYHVSAIMSSMFTSSGTDKVHCPELRSPLQALTSNGKNTQTCWKVTPKISASRTFLLEYDVSFNIANDNESNNQKWNYQKQFFIFSSLRKIVLCPHMTRKFHSA